MKSKNIVLVLVVALVSAGLTYTLMNKKTSALIAHDEGSVAAEAESGESGSAKIAGLQVAVAVAGEGWDTVDLTGKVSVPPDRLVKISPRIEGKIVAVNGMVEESVSRGQVLAVISSVELAEARAQYRHAIARQKAARSSYERELQIAKLGAVSVRPVEEARGESLASQGELADAKSDLSQAHSDLTGAESELVQCKSRLERARELYVGKIVSKQDLETAETEFKRDTAAVSAAKSKVSQAEAKIEKAKSKLDISNQYLSREEKVYKGRVLDMRAVESAKSEVVSAQIEVQAAADRIRVLGANPAGSGDTIAITSPIAGKIVSRDTNVGEMASPSSTMFTVANQSQVWIEADVYEKDLAKVRRGQSAQIRVDAYPDRVFSGTIHSVGAILNPESRSAKIRCVVQNPQGLLKGEMFAKMSLITSKRGKSVLIPKQAILDDAGKKVVFTTCTECPVDKKLGPSACGEYDKAEITTGPTHGNQIEVLKGVEPGTEVVTVGAYQIKTAIGSGTLKAGCTDGH